jgi:dTDP-4-dehydrorhamnose reductase
MAALKRAGLKADPLVLADTRGAAEQPPELWAGVECSVVRVGDVVRDQSAETGHALRLGDLDRVAALGVRTMRYPVIWETVAPDDPAICDWRWTDQRLGRLRELGIEPIAGLVHHGSGPRRTDLLDPEFPEKLAAFAGQAAERYPWLRLWTPVNEPLTTARFSCLYGHWHPHRRDWGCFLRAVVHECRAVALSMQAIRKVNPAAILVQTEDMGRTFSTPALRGQADHENERRWLSLDLLTGRVTKDHPWRRELLNHGVREADLAELEAGQGMPGIIGVNHYLTSDRYLDERIELYPGVAPGGNGRETYVDVEAVRIRGLEVATGPEARLREVWDRYRLPIAVTEAHNSCTREEQLRWFMEVWNAAAKLKAEGVDMRAVTLWSIFGAIDWCSLLTRKRGVVEPGLFDFRSSPPRRTLVAQAAAALADEGVFTHAALDTPGWWRREGRFLGQASADGPEPQGSAAPGVAEGSTSPGRRAARAAGPARAAGHSPRPILIAGATGTLGRALSRICESRGLAHVLTSRSEMEICDARSIEAALDRIRPWAVINTAGFVRVPEAEKMPERCFEENAHGPGRLAISCSRLGLPFVTFSSDLVFDGQAGRPYVETDKANPLSVYGASKHEAERIVAGFCERSLVIRTSAFFGPWDRYNFVHGAIEALRRGEEFIADDAQLVSPTYVPDLAHAVLDLLLDGETGLWHVATPGEISWFELAREAGRIGRLPQRLVKRPEAKPAPSNTALTSARAVLLRPLDEALAAFGAEAEFLSRAA